MSLPLKLRKKNKKIISHADLIQVIENLKPMASRVVKCYALTALNIKSDDAVAYHQNLFSKLQNKKTKSLYSLFIKLY